MADRVHIPSIPRALGKNRILFSLIFGPRGIALFGIAYTCFASYASTPRLIRACGQISYAPMCICEPTPSVI